ncbi:hypothetical protein ACX12M_09725 [Cellulosimicrobium cellulans]
MESASGIVALAVFLLWVGFYVPHRVRHRQQLLDARTDDRFSGSLRVLAVAGPGGGGFDRWDARLDGVTTVAAIASGPAGAGGRPLLGAAGTQSRSEGRTHDEEGTHAMGSTVSASPSRGAPPRRQPASEQSRLELLERRAAAARRRLALTVVLLLATVGVWVVVALGLVPWWAGVVPTAFLGLVLVLGRRAVLAAQRSDAAWLAERRAAARAARGAVLGAPPAPRGARPRVTGRAVHGSQVSTQMIPRVTPQDLARANAAASADAGAPAASSRERVTASGATEGPASEEPAPAADEPGTAAQTAPTVEAVDAEHVPTGRAWDPVPVPPPTYTMKPTAPRREPAPLTDDDVVSPTVSARVEPVVAADARSGAPTPAVGDERKPSTETLGLDLNEILARRRAAGQ